MATIAPAPAALAASMPAKESSATAPSRARPALCSSTLGNTRAVIAPYMSSRVRKAMVPPERVTILRTAVTMASTVTRWPS